MAAFKLSPEHYRKKSDINMKNLRKKAVSDEYKNENSYYFLQDVRIQSRVYL